MIKLIIFDWDDVFTKGSTKGYYKCYHEAVAGVGVHLSEAEEKARIATKWGSSHQEELAALLIDDLELLPRAIEIYESHLFGDTYVNCLSIIPGSNELLGRLSDTYTLALATGVHPKILEKVMLKFGIPNVFSQIITAYDVKDPAHAKPSPYIAEAIMREQNVTHNETIMVGDAKNDVLMAQNAGIEPIVVLTGHLSNPQAEALGVKYIIDDVTKLEDLLSEIQ